MTTEECRTLPASAEEKIIKAEIFNLQTVKQAFAKKFKNDSAFEKND